MFPKIEQLSHFNKTGFNFFGDFNFEQEFFLFKTQQIALSFTLFTKNNLGLAPLTCKAHTFAYFTAYCNSTSAIQVLKWHVFVIGF